MARPTRSLDTINHVNNTNNDGYKTSIYVGEKQRKRAGKKNKSRRDRKRFREAIIRQTDQKRIINVDKHIDFIDQSLGQKRDRSSHIWTRCDKKNREHLRDEYGEKHRQQDQLEQGVSPIIRTSRRKSRKRDKSQSCQRRKNSSNQDKSHRFDSTTKQNGTNEVDHYHHLDMGKDFCKGISDQLLENLKTSGLFDELRMSLMQQIEANDKFISLKEGFKKEIDSFCHNSADLSLPRARLREQLNERNLSESSHKLNKLVADISRNERDRLRELYQRQANVFLETISVKDGTNDLELSLTTKQPVQPPI